jgi:hypothetical protein
VKDAPLVLAPTRRSKSASANSNARLSACSTPALTTTMSIPSRLGCSSKQTIDVGEVRNVTLAAAAPESSDGLRCSSLRN